MADKQQVYTVTVKVIGDQELRALQQQVRGLDTVTKKLGSGATTVKASGNAFKNMGNQVSNASFQLTDFIVQVTNGQDAMRAFGQQAPQLLGAFGAVGAVVGVIASLMPVVVQSFTGLSQSAAETSENLRQVAESWTELTKSASDNVSVSERLAEKYGGVNEELLITERILSKIQRAQLLADFATQTDAVNDSLGSLSGRTQVLDNFYNKWRGIYNLPSQDIASAQRVTELVESLDDLDNAAKSTAITQIFAELEQYGRSFEDLSDKTRESLTAAAEWQQTYQVLFGDLQQLSQENPIQYLTFSDVDIALADENRRILVDSIAALQKGQSAKENEIELERELLRLRLTEQAIREGWSDLYLEEQIAGVTELNALEEKRVNIVAANTAAHEKEAEAIKVVAQKMREQKPIIEEQISIYDKLSGKIETTMLQSFEDIVTNAKSVKEAFKDMVESILADMARMYLQQQVIAPFVAALSPDALGGLVGGVKSPMDHFATGGIISNLGSYRGALVGESGPEAIMPLRRTPSGRLGVESAGGNTTVNVINNTNADASVTETETPGGGRQIDVVIENVVQRGFARGAFDTTLRGAYGLQRRGQGGR